MAEQIEMPRVKLGTQGLEVSKLGYGCMGLSGNYNNPVPDEEGIAVIKEAFSKGITFFDTSNLYGVNYANEYLVGKALKQLPREKIELATKFGVVGITPTEVIVKGSPEYVRSCCEDSLKRLGVDYIDLYYIHRIDTTVPIEETMGELKKLVNEGKIRYIGLSEASPDTIRRAHAVHPISALQIEYSLWTRDIEEDIIPVCRELGIGIVPYSPIGRGFFAGKAVVEKVHPNSALEHHPRFTGENFDKNKAIYFRIEKLAKKHGCTPSQLAIAWVLHQGDDVVPIPGTTKIKNLHENIGSVKVKLTKDDLKEICDAVPVNEVAGIKTPTEALGNFTFSVQNADLSCTECVEGGPTVPNRLRWSDHDVIPDVSHRDLSFPLYERDDGGFNSLQEELFDLKREKKAMAEQVEMPRVKLGTQGLEVSKLGYGCMGLTGGYNNPVPDEEGIAVIKEAFSKGITFFDTANLYGVNYANEYLVGKALKQLPREKIELATKFGVAGITPAEVIVKGSPEYVRSCCEDSLKRLGVDYIDLYYIHRIDKNVPIEVTMGELKKLFNEGKIRYIGLSEASPDTIRRAHAVHPISALQIEYSLWTRDIEEDIIPVCRELGIAIVPYSPVGRGFFAGKAIVEKVPENSSLEHHPRFTGENLDKNKAIYFRIENLAKKHGCTPVQLALAWVLHQGDDVVPIPGTTKIKNLHENIGALKVKLTKDDLKEISDAVPIDEVAGTKTHMEALERSSWRFAHTPLPK
ncbi:unnamed protein product [Fraxinus pennsylvanica]|uniref:NADP-dependent oxidoreductase domain-containing protein n=1 Tax=Fraxinus pennsylvanica TaxID=56036 RepID=A0AAD1ZND8_9LAMI|nr:unnamed protein product [Fraxinus pennsylvanica]